MTGKSTIYFHHSFEKEHKFEGLEALKGTALPRPAAKRKRNLLYNPK